jgi:hypothetical protein
VIEKSATTAACIFCRAGAITGDLVQAALSMDAKSTSDWDFNPGAWYDLDIARSRDACEGLMTLLGTEYVDMTLGSW